MHHKRFAVAYVMLGFFVIAFWASAGVTYAVTHRPVAPGPPVKCAPITNDTYPNKVECHFKGKPLHHFKANLIPGMPPDGYCEDYSNKVSWRVFACYGTQPEAQPGG